MQIQTVSLDVFKSSTSNIDRVFGVKDIKSINGVVVNITTLYLAKKYGEDYSVLTCELISTDDLTMCKPANILNTSDDSIAMALNAIV